MTYLFNQPPAKTRLYLWLRERKWAKTSEILRWGTDNYSNRADRNCRLLAQEGKIKRMDKQKKICYFGHIAEEVWEIIQWPSSLI